MVEVVIAKYKEDTAWTQGLKHPYIIYDKSDSPLYYSVRLPNIGREAHTFLYHIVTNYHKLADVTVFLQGKPDDHVTFGIEECVSKINEMTGNEEFMSFFKELQHDLDFEHYRFIDRTKIFKNSIIIYSDDYVYFNYLPLEHLITFGKICVPSFAAGAQYIVPKRNILARPLEFWKKLLEFSKTTRYLDNDYRRLDAWAFERIWILLYTHIEINLDFSPIVADVEIVVARKNNEELEFIKDIQHLHIDYTTPLIGKELTVYLQHIVDKYERLADVTVFVRQPEDDDTEFSHRINTINKNTTLMPFLPTLSTDISDRDIEILKSYSINIDKTIPYFSGRQYIIPRYVIRKQPIEFWKTLLNLSKEPKISEMNLMEKIWFIFFI
jgi:hypothetical protein